MNKNEANTILAAVNELMAENFPNFECKMSVRRYVETGQVSFKMEMTDESVSETMANHETEIGMAKNRCHPKTLGFEFSTDRGRFIVESVKSRKCKMPVLARCDDGKLYKFPSQYITDRINRDAHLAALKG